MPPLFMRRGGGAGRRLHSRRYGLTGDTLKIEVSVKKYWVNDSPKHGRGLACRDPKIQSRRGATLPLGTPVRLWCGTEELKN